MLHRSHTRSATRTYTTWTLTRSYNIVAPLFNLETMISKSGKMSCIMFCSSTSLGLPLQVLRVSVRFALSPFHCILYGRVGFFIFMFEVGSLDPHLMEILERYFFKRICLQDFWSDFERILWNGEVSFVFSSCGFSHPEGENPSVMQTQFTG